MTAAAPRALVDVSDADLLSLAAALARGELLAPLEASALQSRGFGHLVEVLTPYAALDGEALTAVLQAVQAERRHRPAPKLTLVWTGREPEVSHSRHTRVVLPELFAQARQHVLVAGYSFDSGAELFPALHSVMSDHGVTADFFVDISQLIERLRHAARKAGQDWALLSKPMAAMKDPRQRGEEVVRLFHQLMWPFGEPRPRVHFDPRTASAANAVSLHAKCVVVDHRITLITSANFTNRGQTRNYEAGVLIEDEGFATALERQWAGVSREGNGGP